MADVVLPTTQFAEEEGTLTNLEGGGVLRRRRALDPPDGVRSELEIWHDLADRLGGRQFPDPRTGLRRAAPRLRGRRRGLRRDRLGAPRRRRGAVLAVPRRGPPRHAALFAEGSRRRTAGPGFTAVTHRAVTERLERRYPYLLTTGRSRTHYQSGAQTRRSPPLCRGRARPLRRAAPAPGRGHRDQRRRRDPAHHAARQVGRRTRPARRRHPHGHRVPAVPLGPRRTT